MPRNKPHICHITFSSKLPEMLKYVSHTGGGKPVNFETAILNGFAEDGGLYIPEKLPSISLDQLKCWKDLSFTALAFEVLSLFIDRSTISELELKELLETAYSTFLHEDVIPLHPLQTRPNTYVIELFHGPTLSFKDVGLAFLVHLVHFFLKKKGERKTIVVATTGDTGPATAFYCAGKETLNAWVLYPKNKITPEQEKQMTTLQDSNIFAVGVTNCPDGGDDLDLVIAELFANKSFRDEVHLSSVNSINWGRVMMQMVHYFYGYLKVANEIGEPVHFSVPSGAFGNLCAGSMSKLMGLPVGNFIVANNQNACLHRIFSKGEFSKKEIVETPSSAIDILIPYNFWRHLYFATGKNPDRIKKWKTEFSNTGSVQFSPEVQQQYANGYLSVSISDEKTLSEIRDIFKEENYLLDPHGAVAVAAGNHFRNDLAGQKLICLATAHPAKFTGVVNKALNTQGNTPPEATHPSIEHAHKQLERIYTIQLPYLKDALMNAMKNQF